MKGARQRLVREHNDRAWLAYYSGMIAQAAKPPPLEDLLIKDPSHVPREQSGDDHYALFTAAFPPKKG